MNLLIWEIEFTLLSLHPLCGGGDFLFLLSPPAAAFCFFSHSETPAQIISNLYSQ